MGSLHVGDGDRDQQATDLEDLKIGRDHQHQEGGVQRLFGARRWMLADEGCAQVAESINCAENEDEMLRKG